VQAPERGQSKELVKEQALVSERGQSKELVHPP
jgi:hypothetical protein